MKSMASRPQPDCLLTLAVPQEHRLAGKTPLGVEALENEKLLLLGTGNCFRDQVVQACAARKTKDAGEDDGAQPTPEGSSLETIRHMAEIAQ